MRKEHTRDYCTEAYRFYARSGGYDKYVKDLVEDIKRNKGSGICKPTEAEVISKEEVISDKASELADIEAVEKVLRALETCQYTSVLKAIEMVYFKDCWRDLEKGDIETRVNFAEMHIPASRRQIYYWLKKARKMLAKERGLRV